MPVTLAEAKKNAADDIQAGVIDEFQKSSWLLDNMTFDDVVNPAGGGATLTYGYRRLVTQPTAGFRAVNAGYTPTEVTKTLVTVELKPFGGSYQIDRLIALVGPAAANEVVLQSTQKIKAAQALFNDAVFNGDSGTDANSFDGLDVALTGSSTEIGAATVLDWSGINSEAAAFTAMDDIDSILALLDGPATLIASNQKALAKIRGVARRAGYLTQSENAFGQVVERYGNVVLLDPGKKPGTNNDVIPIETRTVGGQSTTGLTDVYAIRLGLDGFHGVSLAGVPLVQSWLPDFTSSGAVKTGEVEMVAAVALKRTKAAAVRRNVKVQ